VNGHAGAEGSPLSSLRDAYLKAQLGGNRREALRTLIEEGIDRGHPLRQLQLEVVQAAQREIGRLWQENRISIAQEHMATAISQYVLAHLYQHALPEPPRGKKVLMACVEGEDHEFPSRLVADVLDLAGFDVRFLGANVPTDSLLPLLEVERPDVLALSVTMSFNVPSLRRAVERVRQTFPSLPIVVGGHATAWAPGLAKELAVQGWAADATGALQAVEKLVGGRR
jgi:methanogenic corrinoid protein MtbC1